MRRKIKICEKCEYFSAYDVEIVGGKIHVSMWCWRAWDSRSNYQPDFEEMEVPKNCKFYTEQCMSEWNDDEEEDEDLQELPCACDNPEAAYSQARQDSEPW